MPKLDLEQTRPGYDVAIIGAGPAGCIAAKCLAKKYTVLLVDYRSLPRSKPCGGLLVSQAIEELKQFGLSDDFVVPPQTLDIEYVDFDNNTRKTIPKGFMNIDRRQFDSSVFSLVPNSVDVVDRTKLADFTYTTDKKYHVLILESNGSIKPVVANFLIGADGALSSVREKISRQRVPYYIAIQELTTGCKLDRAIFFYNDDITDFYSWIIPKGDKTLIGSALKPAKAREKFNQLKEFVKSQYGLHDGGAIDSAIILRPETQKDICLGLGTVFLVGEAAGLISPSSGEGISFALASGRICAESIITGGRNPLDLYKNKAKPLIGRVISKLEKSQKIKSKKSRLGLMLEK